MNEEGKLLGLDDGIGLNGAYGFMLVAALIAFYLVKSSETRHKFEFFLLAFYLLTGTINQFLTFSLPGVSFFEIQPERLLLLVFSFFLLKRLLFSGAPLFQRKNLTVPWYQLALYVYILFLIASQFYHVNHLGVKEVILTLSDILTFLVILWRLPQICSEESTKILGRAIVVGAVATSLVSIIQLTVEPMFLRMGDQRLAFGDIMRSNGLFNTEYYNSYFLITAISWVMVTFRKSLLKWGLLALFTVAVLCTFQRMSWLILVMVFLIYFLMIEKIAIGRLLFGGMAGMAMLLMVVLFYYRDIANSTLVQERLTEKVDGRFGYWNMVLDNIGKKPIFGYGDHRNEIYYYSMLRITSSRKRATGETGDIHSGYFSSMFYYGVPAFIFFAVFILLSVYYFGKLTTWHLFFAIPFLLALIYAVGNLTNTFLFSKYLATLYVIHLGLGMGMRHVLARTRPETTDPIHAPSGHTKLALQ